MKSVKAQKVNANFRRINTKNTIEVNVYNFEEELECDERGTQ